ncbi:hypothetical protein KY284_026624 [Solanum tuberosum]|nr:hypothetical protein KY284_026624 [Solanum tuberosum]
MKKRRLGAYQSKMLTMKILKLVSKVVTWLKFNLKEDHSPGGMEEPEMIAFLKEQQTCHNIIDIEIFLNDNGCNYNEMQMHVPFHIVEHVKQNMEYVKQTAESDKPWWIKTYSGKFTVKSAWKLLRRREEETDFLHEAIDTCWFVGTLDPGEAGHDEMVGHKRKVFQTQVIRLLHPPMGWWKCNTDGACRGNPGPSAAAFCIRNSAGDLVYAKGVKIQDSTSIVVEAIAVREGLQYYWEHEFVQVLLELDSYALVQMLNGKWEIPWSVTLEVNSINRLRNLMTV